MANKVLSTLKYKFFFKDPRVFFLKLALNDINLIKPGSWYACMLHTNFFSCRKVYFHENDATSNVFFLNYLS